MDQMYEIETGKGCAQRWIRHYKWLERLVYLGREVNSANIKIGIYLTIGCAKFCLISNGRGPFIGLQSVGLVVLHRVLI